MIGILCLGDIRYSPYIEKYTDLLNSQNVDYEFIFWDRFPEKKIKFDGKNLNIFRYPLSDRAKISKKISAFLKFRKYAKKVILEKNYEKLIILTTLTGVFLVDVLVTKYKKKYIFDYRDASYEYLPGFKFLLKRIINQANFTCISSKGFEKILPTGNSFVMAHNFRYKDLSYSNINMDVINTKEPVNVALIGNLRENDYIKKLIDIFSKDDRFVLSIHGGGENLEDIKEYAKECKNVVCTGAYNNSEKNILINKAHIICYNYPSSYINDYALANKYYDSLIYKKPMLGNISTFSGRLIENNKLGISLKLDETNFTDRLFEYIRTLSPEQFSIDADKELKKILIEDSNYMKKVSEFIKS